MSQRLILASSSSIRAEILTRSRVAFEVSAPKIDEDAIKQALQAEAVAARDVADALAEAKARKVSAKEPDALVLGCDQVLELDGALLSKPRSPEEALSQLINLQGNRHTLYSAAVFCENAQPIWRHTGQVRLWMRSFSESWLEAYVNRNWSSIRYAVGSYKLEEEGVRLFERIDGDHFNILGMPVLEILSYLTLRGTLSS